MQHAPVLGPARVLRADLFVPRLVQQVAEGPALAQVQARLSRPPSPPFVAAVVGPTASGKTDLALALAARLGGEVVSADMGQLYRGFDAGTAKPVGLPVHLIDVLDPREPSDAGSYARLAAKTVADILARGKLPILAGGTGFYVSALLDGLDELPRRDPAVRARLEARAKAEGAAALHAELARLDPAAAARIDGRNAVRVVRALEVVALTGRPVSQQWTERPAPYRALYVGLRWSPEALRRRIRERAEGMFPEMVREVRAHLAAGLTGAEPAFRCLGYPEALAVARGETSPVDGLAKMVAATNAYARRQRTWFRGQTPATWLEPAGAEREAARLIEEAR
ncbi:tRNA (adenosine(37)-N6)-dimethylallyltransferase MiaA [bacterium]|nr:MAG: tRNA (adenosine(37)-N6)-dimethylallyltransferase MiaA [bacterium]